MTVAGMEMVFEDVPAIRRRQGDHVIQGANNACIIVGRDRPGRVEGGFGSFDGPGGGRGAGSVTVVVGRSGEDPDLLGDRATVYVSARTDVDGSIPGNTVGTPVRDASGVTVRADCVRILPRRDFRLYIGPRTYVTFGDDGRVVLEGEIDLGEGAAERLLKGETFVRWAEGHIHPTPDGNSGPPTSKVPEDAFSQRPVRVK